MRKHIVSMALISFMILFGLQIAAPVSATKLVDHGAIKGIFHDGSGYYKNSWFTYQKGTNYVKVKNYWYIGDINRTYKYIFVLQKVSKTKLKITLYTDGYGNTYYEHTKLTAAQYYWRIFRHYMISDYDE